jgi:glycosyltransferase involved in cell wall biosynthesis
MRVLILHSRYRSGSASGENRVVEDEARLLAEHGHHVAVWSPSVHEGGTLSNVRTAANAIWSTSATEQLRRLIARYGPDVVHAHNVFRALSPAVLRAVPPSVALVMTLHNYRLACLPGNLYRDGGICEDCVGRIPIPGVVHRCYRGSVTASAVLASSLELHRIARTFDRVDLFLAVSEFLRERHLGLGVGPDRITVKRNFAWPNRRREGPGGPFLYAGRLVPEKGLETLVRAWTSVPAPLEIVGEGPDEARLRAMAPPNVTFRPTVSGDRVAELVRTARAVVVPSEWYETAGRTVLEAYAAGVPVLASRVGALPEVVDDDRTGYLVPPGSSGAWAAAAARLADDRRSTELGANAARAWSESFGPEPAIRALQAAYERARARIGRC